MPKKFLYRSTIRLLRLYQLLRGIKYAFFSTAQVDGTIVKYQPVLFSGAGRIVSSGTVTIGIWPSPFLLNGYAHIEARTPGSEIYFGDKVSINNNCVIVSDGAGIYIGENTIAGTHLQIYDSDFHPLDSEKRMSQDYVRKKVVIGKNVFIGSNVTILKGVTIGDNSVVANGAVVTGSLPANVVAGGNPARIIRTLTAADAP
jgi:acetyltransferase-like isoleucine patch superfamily enzyme